MKAGIARLYTKTRPDGLNQTKDARQIASRIISREIRQCDNGS